MSLTVKQRVDFPLSDFSLLSHLRDSLRPVEHTQKKHEQCDKIDRLAHNLFLEVSLSQTPSPTPAEQHLLDQSLPYFTGSEPYHRFAGSLQTHPTVSMFTRVDVSDSLTWNRCIGDVDDAPPVVLSRVWRFCSYERRKKHREECGPNLVRITDATPLKRAQLVKYEMPTTPGVANRCFKTRYCWFKLGTENFDQQQGGAGSGNDAYALAFEPASARGGGASPKRGRSWTRTATSRGRR